MSRMHILKRAVTASAQKALYAILYIITIPTNENEKQEPCGEGQALCDKSV